jgi:hypothetical protein
VKETLLGSKFFNILSEEMDQTDQTEQTEHLAKVERLRQLLTGILPSRPTRPCRRCAPPHPFHYLVSPVLESARNEDIGEEPVGKDVQEKLIYDNDKDESVDESVKESRNPTLISNEGGSKNRSKEESDGKKPDTTSPDIIPRTPPMCGNERYLDRAKIIKSCTRKALLPCLVCKLIEVSAYEGPLDSAAFTVTTSVAVTSFFSWYDIV